MKKLLVLFALLFSISFFCNDAIAQCRSMQNIDVGKVKVGDTFQLYLTSGDSHIWCSPTLKYEGTSGNYAVYRYLGFLIFDPDTRDNTVIGEITLSSRNGNKCHVIHGEEYQL